MRDTLKSLLTVSLAVADFTALTNAASAGDPYGVWVRPSTGSQVRFYDCGGKLCGKVVAVKEAARKKEIGVVIMKGAAKTADNKWQGDMLDAGTGKLYSGVAVTLESASALSVKGCIMVICQTETWHRAK